MEWFQARIGWRRIDERASFMYNLSVDNQFFLSTVGGVRSSDKNDIIEKNAIRNEFFENFFRSPFIYLLLKSLSSKLLTPPTTDKKYSFST